MNILDHLESGSDLISEDLRLLCFVCNTFQTRELLYLQRGLISEFSGRISRKGQNVLVQMSVRALALFRALLQYYYRVAD
jgi:hypothetical protein